MPHFGGVRKYPINRPVGRSYHQDLSLETNRYIFDAFGRGIVYEDVSSLWID
jgi:hypothetical protein